MTLVAVGSWGKLATSPDGETWTQQDSSFGTTHIQGVAWSPELGLWVAVGNLGTLATSPDGVTWTQQDSSFDGTNIWGVAWSRELGLWVAVGSSVKLATSPDGITWTQQDSSFDGANIWGVAWSRELGLWVAVGDSGQLATSADGVNWTQRTSSFGTFAEILGVAWSPELAQWVAVGWDAIGDSGKLATSTDGVSWTEQDSGFDSTLIRGVAWSPDLAQWVAVGNSGKLATSPDGENWTQRTSSFGTTHIQGVAWSPELGLWVAVGALGKLATSTDGVTWTQRNSNFGFDTILGVAALPAPRSTLLGVHDAAVQLSDGSTAYLETDPAAQEIHLKHVTTDGIVSLIHTLDGSTSGFQFDPPWPWISSHQRFALVANASDHLCIFSGRQGGMGSFGIKYQKFIGPIGSWVAGSVGHTSDNVQCTDADNIAAVFCDAGGGPSGQGQILVVFMGATNGDMGDSTHSYGSGYALFDGDLTLPWGGSSGLIGAGYNPPWLAPTGSHENNTGSGLSLATDTFGSSMVGAAALSQTSPSSPATRTATLDVGPTVTVVDNPTNAYRIENDAPYNRVKVVGCGPGVFARVYNTSTFNPPRLIARITGLPPIDLGLGLVEHFDVAHDAASGELVIYLWDPDDNTRLVALRFDVATGELKHEVATESVSFLDDFPGTELHGRWGIDSWSVEFVDVDNGKLVINAGWNYPYIWTEPYWGGHDYEVTYEVLRIPSHATTEGRFSVWLGAPGRAGIGLDFEEDGTPDYGWVAAGDVWPDVDPFDPTGLFVRIRKVGENIIFDRSPDKSTWTLIYSGELTPNLSYTSFSIEASSDWTEEMDGGAFEIGSVSFSGSELLSAVPPTPVFVDADPGERTHLRTPKMLRDPRYLEIHYNRSEGSAAHFVRHQESFAREVVAGLGLALAVAGAARKLSSSAGAVGLGLATGDDLAKGGEAGGALAAELDAQAAVAKAAEAFGAVAAELIAEAEAVAARATSAEIDLALGLQGVPIPPEPTGAVHLGLAIAATARRHGATIAEVSLALQLAATAAKTAHSVAEPGIALGAAGAAQIIYRLSAQGEVGVSLATAATVAKAATSLGSLAAGLGTGAVPTKASVAAALAGLLVGLDAAALSHLVRLATLPLTVDPDPALGSGVRPDPALGATVALDATVAT